MYHCNNQKKKFVIFHIVQIQHIQEIKGSTFTVHIYLISSIFLQFCFFIFIISKISPFLFYVPLTIKFMFQTTHGQSPFIPRHLNLQLLFRPETTHKGYPDFTLNFTSIISKISHPNIFLLVCLPASLSAPFPDHQI